jgi:Sap, sulfolipid-1-addressing protein
VAATQATPDHGPTSVSPDPNDAPACERVVWSPPDRTKEGTRLSDILKTLPLAFVMIAGPQIISSFFFATSEHWRGTSFAYATGALISVTAFVTAAYFVTKGAKGGGGDSSGESSGHVIDVVILALLAFAALHTFLGRKTAEPPKWMGRLQTATPKFAFVLGLLLLGVFPTDIISSFSVGASISRDGHPWSYTLPFVFFTVFLVALPALLLLVLGKRAEVFLPKARDWMNTNSWIVSEIVIGLFIVLTVNSLVSG